MGAHKGGMIMMVHAENGDALANLISHNLDAGNTDPKFHALSRPAITEGEATNRACVFSAITQCPLYVVHMTCEESIEALKAHRAKGAPVMGETCVSYLFKTAEDLAAPGFEGAKFVCSPPPRTVHDQQVLWKSLQDGTLQTVATDHCNFWYEGGVGPWKEWMESHPKGDWVEYEAQDPTYRRPGKEMGKGNFAKIPNGMPGIEDRMVVLWEHGVNKGRLTPSELVQLCCTNPAKIFGCYPKKGTLSVGSDADIVVWDPTLQHTISVETTHMKTDYNIFEGMQCTGKPSQVFVRGRKVVDGDTWLGANGQGRFVPRKAHNPVVSK
eukprot:NODE_210_length_1112_cov_297.712841_g207_i0.p1 GENE.NODE_210_length_1112_cov_297.712841_g207_i0~~NODE_210_length_1112_cov_297.712841_g207_i0.p1  ORF type:complete len:325 (+),score=56.76 NODE_210_length_1112_cov_297.712841_g207_i0:49-1023(+)